MSPSFDRADHARRIQWFTHARFGLFIHWGVYAIPARGEWYRSHAQLPQEAYDPYLQEFNPTEYDPAAWARAAKRAGMQYAVLTTKHHDGFCLFDSALTDYKATNTPAGRDLVQEYVDAFRAEGIKIGFYHSLIDWKHPGYPAWQDQTHPQRNDPAYENHPHDFDSYITYLHGQVRELLTNYGKIDIMWFDYSYEGMASETWKAADLVKMIRTLQPDIIINDRLERTSFSTLKTAQPEYFAGDFISPEQLLPPEGVFDEAGHRVPWEACVTMNQHWGYVNQPGGYKTPRMLVRKLIECVSKGGNLLLNVGPDAKGRFPAQSLATLQEIGDWMEQNNAAIYGCGYAGITKPDFGRVTRSENGAGNKIYFHVTEPPIGLVSLTGIPVENVAKVRSLADGSELRIVNDFRNRHYKDVTFVHSPHTDDTYPAYVIEVTLRDA